LIIKIERDINKRRNERTKRNNGLLCTFPPEIVFDHADKLIPSYHPWRHVPSLVYIVHLVYAEPEVLESVYGNVHADFGPFLNVHLHLFGKMMFRKKRRKKCQSFRMFHMEELEEKNKGNKQQDQLKF
jgi:hypothetical protein